ncbi:hypothetical protein [Saccharolobus caldissimus]|uniref:Uncharacterized protein n=1 Tax=Saccharolobus caldissimus TaxID=1702097 RepID=A0AAQ4CMF4_9CREN|nr:hypothetical protein [Saccharolobus caldissimus]BDB96985.1 hypothetical protein SACC_00020 [Saccharolobus caldissimus]
MIFRYSLVVKYLLSRPKHFATIRLWNYREGEIVKLKLILNHRVVAEGRAKILRVHDYSLDILQKYLQYSGFEKVEEWINAARELKVSSNRSKVIFGELLELHDKLGSLPR